jgi:hypothetical protein
MVVNFLNYKLLITIILVIILNPLNLFANEIKNCFSYIPYAYNSLYVTLPNNKDICYYYDTKKIKLKTNANGGRIISNKGSGAEIIAFGESQLLGLDWPQNKNNDPHDLEVLFPEQKITAYAAPNNGPYEWLRRIDILEKNNTNYFQDKEIVLGFNYGSDIFRIRNNWKPEIVIPFNENDLKYITKSIFLYELFIIKARLFGKFFQKKSFKSSEIISEYLSIGRDDNIQNIKNLLKMIKQSPILKSKKLSIIFYPPWWNYDTDSIYTERITKDFEHISCIFIQEEIFSEVLVSSPKKRSGSLTYDGRHYINSELNYSKKAKCD